MKGLTPEDYWKIYKTLPQDLKEAIFSEDTAEAIWNICRLCNINNVSKVAELVGDVLCGLLPPSEFKEKIIKELNIDEQTANKLFLYIQHYVFDPVRDDLEKLYEEAQTTKTEVEASPPKKDLYREPLE